MFSTKTALSVLLVAAVSLPATVALAAEDTATPATPSSVRVEGAYAYQTTYAPAERRYVAVVFKTHGQLPRRFDASSGPTRGSAPAAAARSAR